MKQREPTSVRTPNSRSRPEICAVDRRIDEAELSGAGNEQRGGGGNRGTAIGGPDDAVVGGEVVEPDGESVEGGGVGGGEESGGEDGVGGEENKVLGGAPWGVGGGEDGDVGGLFLRRRESGD